MWMMPAVVITGLVLAIAACGGRAVWGDLRARRWVWAVVGTIATAASLGALLLVVTHASLTAPLGL